MTLRHMRIFAEVYRTRNVTHAAQNLHMTQPAVTRPIRDAAMTRRHVVAWHKEKYLTASMRRFITLCRSAAEEMEKQ